MQRIHQKLKNSTERRGNQENDTARRVTIKHKIFVASTNFSWNRENPESGQLAPNLLSTRNGRYQRYTSLRGVSAQSETFSRSRAMPWPPPMHADPIPYFTFSRLSKNIESRVRIQTFINSNDNLGSFQF
jgi:hypothetical protein